MQLRLGKQAIENRRKVVAAFTWNSLCTQRHTSGERTPDWLGGPSDGSG